MVSMRSWWNRSRAALLAAAGGVALLQGCNSHGERVHVLRQEFYSGDLATAETHIGELLKKPKHDKDVLELDRASILLTTGRPKEAEKILREIRDRFDTFEQKDAGEIALSLVTDDNRRAYAGEDYEKVLIRAFLALSNLMHDGGDATAYSLQIADKQSQILERLQTERDKDESSDKPALPKIPQVALGPYVRAMLAEESRLDYDDAIRARTLVCSYEPSFKFGREDLQRAEHSVNAQPGHGVVYVFGLLGKGPIKVQEYDVPTQAALLVADQIVSATSKQSVPPTLAPVPVPKLIRRQNRIRGLEVVAGSESQGTTAMLVNVGELAEKHYEATYPKVIAYAVARRVIKKGLVYAAKEGVQAQNSPGVDIAMTLAGMAWEANETADTRCWGLLPDQIQVLRVELPAGQQSLRLQPIDEYGRFGVADTIQVNVEDGRNTYVLANFPDGKVIGRTLVSGQLPTGSADSNGSARLTLK